MTTAAADRQGSWLPSVAPSGRLVDVMALRPDLMEQWAALESEVWQVVELPPVVLELCRLRMASLLGAGAELRRRTPAAVAAGLSETVVEGLASWPSAPISSDATLPSP